MFIDDIDAYVVARWNVPAENAEGVGVRLDRAQHCRLPPKAKSRAATRGFARGPSAHSTAPSSPRGAKTNDLGNALPSWRRQAAAEQQHDPDQHAPKPRTGTPQGTSSACQSPNDHHRGCCHVWTNARRSRAMFGV